MLNDIKAPPLDINGPANNGHGVGRSLPNGDRVMSVPVDERIDSPTHASLHMKANTDRQEPGLHRARYLGEKGATDAVYEMPMEDRGSDFSIGLSIVVMVVFVALIVAVWFTMR